MDHIEQLKNDMNERLTRLDAEIVILSERGDVDPHKTTLIKERRDRRAQIEQMYTNAIEDAQVRQSAETLAEKIRENRLSSAQEKEAARLAERKKYASWKIFFANGGTREQFEQQWPQLAEKLMLQEMANPQQPARKKSASL